MRIRGGEHDLDRARPQEGRQHDWERRPGSGGTRADGNLSETVERLLAGFVTAERRRRDDKERRIDPTIAMLNDLYDRHGGLGEEFSPL
jgi:hypothetical protein